MKIGIMGGTFNPIHNGHLTLAATALEQYRFDEIWFMPSGLPAHKSNAELLSAKHRLRMVELAIKGKGKFKASSFEIERDGFTYTADTMAALKESYPETEFFFIIGGDSLMKFHQWVKPDVISSYVTLVAAGRDNYTKEELEQQAAHLKLLYGTNVLFLNMPEVAVSSKEIRSCCKCREYGKIKHYLPEAVMGYIMENNLYQS